MSLPEEIFSLTKKCEILGNPLRATIILIVAAKEETTWSDLKDSLQKLSGGGVNPNTLSFHIGRLMDTDLLKKIDIEGQPRYRITEDGSIAIEKMFGQDLINRTKEEIAK